MRNRIAALLEGTTAAWSPAAPSTPVGPLEVRVHRCVLEAIIQHNMREDLHRTATEGERVGFESARQRLRRYEQCLAWLASLPDGTVRVSLRAGVETAF